ncbi:hypothetical protein OHA72_23470 [Dactylosporangium sp. NBC_01737]|uniref:hypothetical protein n=1 Tax=Dactylosporangium sp. NBC_01737 TaxID=2975959 RepID=UPI002E1551A9|nr:hypothetical protein OHA72_23470 [Dactylosporangium sp. NBC_01737]
MADGAGHAEGSAHDAGRGRAAGRVAPVLVAAGLAADLDQAIRGVLGAPEPRRSG